MVPSGVLTLGQRIELARRRRGLSRQTLASLVGRSAEWLRQVEKNERNPDRLSTLLRLVEVLHIKDAASFLGISVAADRQLIRQQRVPRQFREAVLRFRSGPELSFQQSPEALKQLDIQVSDSWNAWQNSPQRYSNTMQRLPKLLEAAAEFRSDDDRESQHLTADTYRLTSVFARETGDAPLALLAIERGMAAADRSKNPVIRTMCAAAFGEALLRLGMFTEASEFCLAAARNLGNELAQVPTDAISAWGAIYLTAAESEALQSNHHAAELFMAKAAEAATYLAEFVDNSFHLTVTIQAVRIELLLGRTRQALRLASKVDVADSTNREMQVRHFLNVAAAHSENRNPVAATFALLKADEVCPEEIRFNAEAQLILQSVLRQENAVVQRELWGLAERADLV